MRNRMRTVLIYALMLQWSLQVTAGMPCLSTCDLYDDYYCDTSEGNHGNCKPCLSEDDAPKCAEYFDSIRRQSTPDTQKDAPLTTPIPSHQINNTVLPDGIKPTTQDMETNDKERNQKEGHERVIELPGNTNKNEKHTDVIIIVSLVSLVTLCVSAVVTLYRRNRSQHGTRTTTVMTSGDDEGLPVVVVDQRSGAAKRPPQPKEETAV